MPSDWQNTLNVVAGLASILGAGLSFAAWRSAESAKVAAKRARKAIKQSTAASDVRRLRDCAQELLACVQNDHLEAALVRSRDLVVGIAETQQRWLAFLGASATEFDDISSEAGRISRALSAGRAAMSPEVRQKLLKSCHEVTELLAQELGKMLRRTDGGPNG